MTTLNLQVAVSADDAKERGDGASFSAGTSVVEVIASTSGAGFRWNGGVRFAGVTIPQAATIVSAYLQPYVTSTTTDDIAADIYGNLVANANDFSTEADINSRALTAANVSWIADAVAAAGVGFYNSPNIGPIIQEIVNQAAWASGNAFAILLFGRSDASKTFRFHDRANGSANACKITIEYTDGGGASAVPVIANQYRRRRAA